ncbi:type I restriction endonuclease subunit R [Hymenobacter gummosus]|uniref:type I site-specific deoxyribonuclease n=1 Tax=Hymenobacter gummosus TaxID=1776032 RepID=A0A3S0K3A0_9BACT|nr:type I restriction endonuclease [Hymenobacter gummosus]RTQ47507.1 type I restriction endonuclease subunit R [Hymenobacter gummosus]
MSPTPEYLQSEQPALQLLQQLGYQYLPGPALSAERPDAREVLLPGRLRAAIARLNPTLDAANQARAYDRLAAVTGELLEANEQGWKLLLGTDLSLKQDNDFPAVRYLDFQRPANNDWLVVSQPRFQGRLSVAEPDIVVFVNGLPLAVLECKAGSATGAWDSAYHDLAYYQHNNERLFHYNVLCAGLWQVGAKYGAIGTPQPFYASYNDLRTDAAALAALLPGGRQPTPQDRLLYHLLAPARLLALLRHFVLFEREEGRTVKKLPRYQQVRAVNRTIANLRAHDQGGVVWHTQGSGKSLTMAYLIRRLQAAGSGFDNPTVLVLTDRTDLDRQITTTLRGVGLPVQQAHSVKSLAELLRNDYGGIITSTLQKFQQPDAEAPDTDTAEADTPDTEGITRTERYIMDNLLVQVTKALRSGKWTEESREEIPLTVLSAKPNLYVLVDEAHRSQYGFLAAFMRSVLPNAKFVAFTGTPISKEDKSTLAEFYGRDYLDTYTIREAVDDGATVPLLYDAGIARLDVRKAELDAEFEAKYGHEPEEKKTRLKDEALRQYQLSAERIEAISRHLLDHYRAKIRPDGYKAILVCAGRRAAVLYKQAIDKLRDEGVHDFSTRVVVSLGAAKSDKLAAEQAERLAWNREHPQDPVPLLLTPPEDVKQVTEDFKLPFGDEAARDKSGKKKQFDNTAILIVSDMLLTGYDAPIAACLYLDKPLKEHSLLQAIARVNRTYRGKAEGYILDYSGITADLLHALEIFSGDVRPDDILRNLNDEIPKLALHHGQLLAFSKPLKLDRHYQREKFIDAFIPYLEPLYRRDEFKVLLKAFNKSIHIVLPNVATMPYQYDFALFNEIRRKARNAYPDGDPFKVTAEESRHLQQLIDEHLRARGVDNLLAEPVSIIDREKFRADILDASPTTKELKMRHQLKYEIKLGLGRSPAYYQPLSDRLDELIRDEAAGRITQAQLLLAYEGLLDAIVNEQREGQAEGFRTEYETAVFNSLKAIFDGQAAGLTRQLFHDISGELDIVGWKDKGEVKKEMENKLYALLKAQLPGPEARQKARELILLIQKNA